MQKINAKIMISGGTVTIENMDWDPLELLAVDSSEIILAGENFNYPLNEPITDTRAQITGNWMSGEPIEWDFHREPDATIRLVQGVLGDFNCDLEIGVGDIDILSYSIQNESNGPQFDLDKNGVINSSDQLFWLSEIGNSFVGDANFDGEFNSTDLVAVFQASEYEDGKFKNSTWATGDWTGDLEFGSSDLVYAFQNGGYEEGPRAVSRAVPEPSSNILLTLALVARLYIRMNRFSFDSI